MTLPDKYRTSFVKITDGVADDIRKLAAYVSRGKLPDDMEGPLQSLVALIATIGEAQAERDLLEQRAGERSDYR